MRPRHARPATTTQWLFFLAHSTNWGRRFISDQHIVQRYPTARTDRQASAGAIWKALMCVPIWAAFMFVGGHVPADIERLTLGWRSEVDPNH